MKRPLLLTVYAVLVSTLVLVVLELAARWMGLGDPILYYNAAYGGMRPLPGQHEVRLNDASVTVDEFGFRSASTDTSADLRILYIGDSVTWGGTQIDDTRIFSEVAADVLREGGTSVYAMNAGVNGAALLNQVEIFMQYADFVDAVVWLFPWADVNRVYSTVGYLYPARFDPKFALVEIVDHVLLRFWLTAFREDRATPESEFTTPEVPSAYAEFMESTYDARREKNLVAAARALTGARDKDLPLVVGITPYEVDGRLLPIEHAAIDFLADADSSGAAILDVSGALVDDSRGGAASGYYQDGIHFTAEGHAVVGTALGRVLERRLREESAAISGQEK